VKCVFESRLKLANVTAQKLLRVESIPAGVRKDQLRPVTLKTTELRTVNVWVSWLAGEICRCETARFTKMVMMMKQRRDKKAVTKSWSRGI